MINQIPPHRVFISPFLGDCAVLRKKRPAQVQIGVDRLRSNLDRWSQNPLAGSCDLRLYCCDGTDWLRHAFDLYRVPDPPSHNLATAAAVAAFGVPASEIFVYIDPPYILSSRRSQSPMYEYEMTDGQHGELLAVVVRLPCRVMVSHYPHPLYQTALKSWRTWTYRSQTRGGKLATEQVWCNFEEPDVLHDTRFLGANKRQRERIRRRRRNWSAGLARMPAMERQAILDEIQQRYGGKHV